MKIKYLFILLIFGCSTSGLKRNYIGGYQNTSTIFKYFYPDLPLWANFSQTAQCQRSFRGKVFDFKNLEMDTSFDYKELVQFQYLYNIEYNRLLQSLGEDTPSVKEEEQLFYNVLANIRTGIYGFNAPKYQRIHLIWIDPYLADKKDFLKLINSNALVLGHPVFISLCLSHQEVVDLINQNDLQNKDIRILSFEAFSLFDSSLRLQNALKFDFHQFFEKNQKLILYNPKDFVPSEFFGDFEDTKQDLPR